MIGKQINWKSYEKSGGASSSDRLKMSSSPEARAGLAFKRGRVAHNDAAYLKVAFYAVQFLWCFGELVQDVAAFTEHFL